MEPRGDRLGRHNLQLFEVTLNRRLTNQSLQKKDYNDFIKTTRPRSSAKKSTENSFF